jgi:hypothetical protein
LGGRINVNQVQQSSKTPESQVAEPSRFSPSSRTLIGVGVAPRPVARSVVVVLLSLFLAGCAGAPSGPSGSSTGLDQLGQDVQVDVTATT